MEEGQVTIEGETRGLEAPFFVIATQNPLEQSGTFPLPESQLDRFLMRIHLGYPDREAEKRLLRQDRFDPAGHCVDRCLTAGDVSDLQRRIDAVHLSDAVIDYVEDLLVFTRRSKNFAMGLSPRAGLALVRAARGWAFLHGRDFLLPEDVQQVMPWVIGHRLRAREDLRELPMEKLEPLLRSVPIP
jgi:MoxR-like ATPase